MSAVLARDNSFMWWHHSTLTSRYY